MPFESRWRQIGRRGRWGRRGCSRRSVSVRRRWQLGRRGLIPGVQRPRVRRRLRRLPLALVLLGGRWARLSVAGRGSGSGFGAAGHGRGVGGGRSGGSGAGSGSGLSSFPSKFRRTSPQIPGPSSGGIGDGILPPISALPGLRSLSWIWASLRWWGVRLVCRPPSPTLHATLPAISSHAAPSPRSV